MRKSLWMLAVGILIIGASNASAKTPDGQTPSQETVCDNETGAAYGLCNSYCEAKDCDNPNHHASDQACESVKKNFEKKTGRPLPCLMTCPCAGLLQLFADIESGAVQVRRCIADTDIIQVTTTTGDFALINDAGCSVNGEGQIVPLTAQELLICRVTLRKAAEAQGIVCMRRE